MQQRRVVLVGDARLLSTGVALLLQTQPHMGLITLDAADPEVFAKVREAMPEVVVVSTSDAARSFGVVARILRENPAATVIAVGLEPTELNVYRLERVAQASPEELLAAIEGS